MKFRLAILLAVLTALVAVAAVKYWPTPRRMSLERLDALDGTYVEQTDPEDGPRQVFSVVLTMRKQLTTDDLVILKDLRPLHRLLLDGSPVTDDGLAQIGQLRELELLNLTGCPVTDAGLVHLEGLGNLKMLSLRGTKVTDAGLVHLRGLTHLKTLNLLETTVSDQGVAELRRALPNLGRIDLHPSPDD